MKILSNEEEKQLVEDYRNGISVTSLMIKYGFATKKSITDKIKKHFPESYDEIVKEAKTNRKGYCYKLEKIRNEFDAYFVGLLLTDGYISNNKVGIDLTDEDCIQFLSKVINKPYKTYNNNNNNCLPKHRLVLSDNELVENLRRFGVVPNKSLTLEPPILFAEEEKFIPYIIRGIIDGDGGVSPTSYGAPQMYIVSMSSQFAEWIKYVLENKLYMKDVSIHQHKNGIYRVETANKQNIEKLLVLAYDKPFGMNRKYNLLREKFRDYHSTPLNTKG